MNKTTGNTDSWESQGNVHLDLGLEAIMPYHEKIAELFIENFDANDPNFCALDIGCGVGNVEKALKRQLPGARLDIADAYQQCLETTHAVGNIGESYMIDELLFDVKARIEKKYDVIVMSHVLEHLIFPAEALDEVLTMLKPSGVLIVAVPNPVRPSVFIANIFKLHYVNRGHVHSWDRSHWINFLENIMGCEVSKYQSDYIQLPWASKSALLRKIGKVFVRVFPWWGFSNIAVVKPGRNSDCYYDRWSDAKKKRDDLSS